jgi:hypothetical protein
VSERSRWAVGAALAALVVALGAPPVGAQVETVPPVVSPPVADPGDPVTVSGSFSLPCSSISVELDGTIVATIGGPNVVPAGAYQTTFIVPATTADDDHVVLVACNVSGGSSAVHAVAGLTTPLTPPPTTASTTIASGASGTTGATTTTIEVIPTSPSVTAGPGQTTAATDPPAATATTPGSAGTGSTGTIRATPSTVTDLTDVDGPPSPSASPTTRGTSRPGETAVPGSTATTGPAVTVVPTVTGAIGPTGSTGPGGGPATTTAPAVGLALDRPAVAPGGDVTAKGTGCRPGTPVDVTAGRDTVGQATADSAGGFESALDTAHLPLGRHRLQASCGALLEADLDIVLVADVGGAGPSLAFIWIVILVAIALSQAHPWKRARRTSVR